MYTGNRCAATDGKVVVICCSEGIIKTIDIKTHKVLFDKIVSNADFNSIIYNGKQFVAVQNKKYIAVSIDGVKWIMKKTNVQLSAICFNGKKYGL
jgi:hypothetical protein